MSPTVIADWNTRADQLEQAYSTADADSKTALDAKLKQLSTEVRTATACDGCDYDGHQDDFAPPHTCGKPNRSTR